MYIQDYEEGLIEAENEEEKKNYETEIKKDPKSKYYDIPELTEDEVEAKEHHVISGIMWMRDQPESKKEFAIRLQNLPSRASQ